MPPSHLFYTSEDISQSQTRVKLNRMSILRMYSLPVDPPFFTGGINPDDIYGVSTPVTSSLSRRTSTSLKPAVLPTDTFPRVTTALIGARHGIATACITSEGTPSEVGGSGFPVPGCLAQKVLTLDQRFSSPANPLVLHLSSFFRREKTSSD